ncbi:dipeptide ABC transporter ATP-binding protein [Paenalcaligenes faecalis]|uniref:dipeptide ABC transporter ATP-binding protein n=1 Tax=Paenalcaligenes faecalis TaxID=2980099 RepID=UPI0022B9423D|nr:dipeptide ABC transporter ATP-binding protein [Paenalcaligenes faecalis]
MSNVLLETPQQQENQQTAAQRIIEVNHLSVDFHAHNRVVNAVKDLSFSVNQSETLAIVGESGSGKSVTSLALMRLVQYGGGIIKNGQMLLQRSPSSRLDLATASQSQMRTIRGADVAMIFQEPMTSLNPIFQVGEQIAESVRLHQGVSQKEAMNRALQMLDQVRIADAKNVLYRYPHQLSGGMRQRVMIAMALACKPKLLIADEPTTALDVTIQAQIIQLIRELQQEMGMGVIFITHDMGVVAEIADRVLVMLRGEQVETGTAEQIFAAPQHAYTKALLAAVPRLGSMTGTDLPARFPTLDNPYLYETQGKNADQPSDKAPDYSKPILQVKGLSTRFDIRSGIFNKATHRVHAVEKVNFELFPGETLSIVGESGCGKSTTGRSLLRLVESQEGEIIFDGHAIQHAKGQALQHLRRNIQFIFQDPYASLDPRMTVGYSIIEPLLIHKLMSHNDAQKRMSELLEKVGLPASAAQRYPHEFSGGQRQRICIARALAMNPKIVIADESVSALDVSIQAQIVNLLIDLQQELGVAFLFISHDMAVVERISHRVAVMYLGQVVEVGTRRDIFENPQHPYTRRLLSAVPIADPTRRHLERKLLTGEIPSPIRKIGNEPTVQPLVHVSGQHYVAKHDVGF